MPFLVTTLVTPGAMLAVIHMKHPPHGCIAPWNVPLTDLDATAYRTYTTPYCGSVCVLHSAQHAASPSAAHDSAPAEAEWTELGHQMDKSLLMERDPILYFDDLPLYESELDDNGVSQLRVKVSVQGGSLLGWQWGSRL